jgi:hypothetical protein
MNQAFGYSIPLREVRYIGTGGVLDDPAHAAALRDEQLPPTAAAGRRMVVLHLGGVQPTPAALREIVVTLGQRVRGGLYGETKVVIATGDPATQEMIGLLGQEYDLPLYVASSSDPRDVEVARPVGDLTQSQRETLDQLRGVGGGATAAGLATVAGVSANTVSNRLLNLERRGYIYRLERNRRLGDVFADPRTAEHMTLFTSLRELPSAAPERDALLRGGIRGNPYDRSPVRPEGETADWAADVVRRRNTGR